MTSYGLDEWFWAMFEPTWTWTPSILPDESAFIMQVVLKIYVYYNDIFRLFGIF